MEMRRTRVNHKRVTKNRQLWIRKNFTEIVQNACLW
jgi:hypothetical protein